MLRKESVAIIDELLEGATPEELDYILRKSSSMVSALKAGGGSLLRGGKNLLRGGKSLLGGSKRLLQGTLNSAKGFGTMAGGVRDAYQAARGGLGKANLLSVGKSAFSAAAPSITAGAKQAAPILGTGAALGAGAGLYGAGRYSKEREYRGLCRLQRLRQLW